MSATATFDWAGAIAKADNPFHVAISRYQRAPIAFIREVLDAQPDPWQLEALRALARGHTRIAIRSGHGVGKAHSIGMVVPTPDGARRWGDLQPGDRLFGRDGEATHIIARHDQGVKPIYRVTFDDGTYCRVDAEHLWTVRGYAQRRTDTKRLYRKGAGRDETQSAYAGDYITLTTADLLRRGVKRRNGTAMARQWELPPHGAVQYPAQDVPVPPYFVGAVLADGSLTRGNSMHLTGSGEKAAHWKAVADRDGLSVRAWQRDDRRADVWLFTVYGQADALRELRLAGQFGSQRSVPRLYCENTPAVRLAVLQGLMDADGYADNRGIAVYTSVSRNLAEDVAWLVRSLGGKAHVGSARPSHYRRADGERVRVQDHYDVTVRLPPGLDLFTMPSKARHMRPCQPRYLTRWIDRIEPDGEMEAMCVTVDAPDGLYLANDFIVTHNTAFAAWTMTWFANTRAPFKVACTAPSAPQLFDALWPELVKWFQVLPPAWRELWNITTDRIQLKSDQECFITARTSRADQPEAMAGLHSTHILLVADEASGIDERVYEAAGGSMSSAGAVTILIGNPTRNTGFFWRCHTLERDRWFTMAVSSAQSPRVSGGYAEEMEARYGIASNAYRIRVLGEFPNADADTFISAELVDQAMVRPGDIDLTKPEIWGLDCARFGDDSSVLIKRRGNVVTEMPRAWHQLDTMQVAGAVKAEYDIAAAPNKPKLICVDAIGIGSGVADRLMEQGLPVLAVNVGESPSTVGRYARLRDELWGRGRDWLESRTCRLPKHERLRDDLCAPRYTFMSDGRVQIETKNSMRSRGLPSSDYADALLLTFADQTLGINSHSDAGLYSMEPVMAPNRAFE